VLIDLTAGVSPESTAKALDDLRAAGQIKLDDRVIGDRIQHRLHVTETLT